MAVAFQIWDCVIPDHLCKKLCQRIDNEQIWLPTSDVKRLPTCDIWSAVVALVQILLPSHLEPKGDYIHVRKNLADTFCPWHNDRPRVGSHTAIVYLNDTKGGQLEILGPEKVHHIPIKKGRMIVTDIKYPHRALKIMPQSCKYTIMISVGYRHEEQHPL